MAGALGAGSAAAQTVSSIKVGGMCDRTGATKIIGAPICSGVAELGTEKSAWFADSEGNILALGQRNS